MESRDKARRRILAEKPRNRRASGKLGAVRIAEQATVSGASGARTIITSMAKRLFPHRPPPPSAVSTPFYRVPIVTKRTCCRNIGRNANSRSYSRSQPCSRP